MGGGLWSAGQLLWPSDRHAALPVALQQLTPQLLNPGPCCRQDAILLGRQLAAPTEPGAPQPSRHRSLAEPAAVTGGKRRASSGDQPAHKRQRGELLLPCQGELCCMHSAT